VRIQVQHVLNLHTCITEAFTVQVTMIGGHVVEFGSGGEQIVALHTMP
jgi:hypothetical protein